MIKTVTKSETESETKTEDKDRKATIDIGMETE